MKRMMRLLLPCGLFLLAFAPAASATDGVVLINQATAATGLPGCGTSPFALLVICQPGSYRLSGNLTVAAPLENGIEILASRVTLDLNGFTITGINAAGFGIFVNPVDGVTAENGTVTGFQAGVYDDSQSGIIRGITANGNTNTGIVLVGGLIDGCIVMGNNYGFSIGFGTVERSTISGNALTGILGVGGTAGVLLLDNYISQPGNAAIASFSGTPIAYGKNFILGSIGSGVSLGDNYCNGGRC